MPIVYTSADGRRFHIIERYEVDQKTWVRYNNSEGREFTCLEEAFHARFTKMEQE